MTIRPRILVCTESYPPQIAGSSVVVRHLLAGTAREAEYLVATAVRGAASLEGISVVSRDLPPVFYRRDARVGLSDFARMASRPVLFRAFFDAAGKFRPGAVLSVFPSDRFLILGDALAAALGVPHAVWFHNLWEETLRYAAAHGGSAGDRARLRAAEKRETGIVARAAARFALTEPMAAFLAAKHGVPFGHLPHAFPPAPPRPARAGGREGPLDLLLPGSIYGMHASSLRPLLDVVAGRTDVTLSLTAELSRREAAALGVAGLPGVTIGRIPDEDRFQQRLGEADACAVCLAGDGCSPEDAAAALPTRAVESFRFGKPLLAVAPRGAHLFRLVAENGAGVAADPGSREGISGAVDALRDAGRRRELAAGALRLFAERFSVGRVGPAFVSGLRRLT